MNCDSQIAGTQWQHGSGTRKEMVLHAPSKRTRPTGSYTGMVRGLTGGVQKKAQVRSDAVRKVSIYWEVTCARCSLVQGADEDGEYQEDALNSASGSDGSDRD